MTHIFKSGLLDTCQQRQQNLTKLLVVVVVAHVSFSETKLWALITCGSSLRPSCRPAACSRAREKSSGAKQGAGARAAADVLHQPGATAGDRGKKMSDFIHYWTELLLDQDGLWTRELSVKYLLCTWSTDVPLNAVLNCTVTGLYCIIHPSLFFHLSGVRLRFNRVF